MAASIGANCSIIVDGYDLSCAFREITFGHELDAVESTALCTTGDRSFTPGLKQQSVSLSGMYDFDDANEDEIGNVLDGAFEDQASLVLSASLGELTIGGRAFMSYGGQTNFDISSVLNELIVTEGEILPSGGGLYRGAWLFNAAVDTTTTVGTSVDNAAGTTNGGKLHFHAHTPDGTITNASILIEHSTDNAIWATLIAATPLGAGSGAMVIEVAPGTTVNRYLRATVTTTAGEATIVAAFYRAA